MEAVLERTEQGNKALGDGLMLASIGVAYNVNQVLWDNLGVNKLTFMQYHQEFQKAYKELATELEEKTGVTTKLGRYGIAICYYGKQYLYSKDYVTGQNIVAGDESVFANNLIRTVDLDSKRVNGRYLTSTDAEEVRHVAVEQFIILPTEHEMWLKDKLVTISLTRPKDWMQEMQRLTEKLGLERPNMHMEKGDILIQHRSGKKKKVEWKYDKESVKTLIYEMCKFWEKDKTSNRKPDNNVVRGGGITLVNLTQEQKDYREYIKQQVRLALGKSKKVTDVHRINFSNTTTSCYVDFTDAGLYDLKVSIRDHEEMHENGYYRFYIDAVGREEFSDRLALVIDALVKSRQSKRDGRMFQ